MLHQITHMFEELCIRFETFNFKLGKNDMEELPTSNLRLPTSGAEFLLTPPNLMNAGPTECSDMPNTKLIGRCSEGCILNIYFVQEYSAFL